MKLTAAGTHADRHRSNLGFRPTPRDAAPLAGRDLSREPQLLLYAGGFARLGGIESFLSDLAATARQRGLGVTLLCWGSHSTQLAELKTRLVSVFRLPWRWGCRWAWPDRLLLPVGRCALRQADVVVFGKLFDERVHRRLMGVKLAQGGPPFVLVTPYRPAEMWADGRPAEDVLNSFDAVVVQAECFAADLRGIGYRGEIRVLSYLPPACGELAAPPADAPLRIGFLGRLVPDKNLPLLLRAFAVIRRQLPAELHLFGDGGERSLLERLAAELGVAERVGFHGAVPRSAVAGAIDSCHLFAFASVTEGQVMAALEILARGRPLVTTPVGVFPELLSESRFGRLAPLDDVSKFAETLLRVAQDLREGRLAHEDVQHAYRERFSRDHVLDQYLGLFRELAGARLACK